jgi:hypothetical protein
MNMNIHTIDLLQFEVKCVCCFEKSFSTISKLQILKGWNIEPSKESPTLKDSVVVFYKYKIYIIFKICNY